MRDASKGLPQLLALFPNLDVKVVEGAYNTFSGDFDRALELLLKLDSPASEPAKRPTVVVYQKEIPAPKSAESIIVRTIGMPYNSEATRVADLYGLKLVSPNWAHPRDRPSGLTAHHPCDSDFTIQIGEAKLPIIRPADPLSATTSIPSSEINVRVGNEMGEKRHTVNLRHYLNNFPDYLSYPSHWRSGRRSLWNEHHDSKINVTCQASFLPSPDKLVHYELLLTNHRPPSTHILAIVCTSSGTSAQIVESGKVKSLRFNSNGKRALFHAKTAKSRFGEPGNVALVLEIPLLVQYSYPLPPQPRYPYYGEHHYWPMPPVAPPPPAVVDGEFPEFAAHCYTRDAKYPIKATLHFWEPTDTGAVDSEKMLHLASVFQQVYTRTANISRLLLGMDFRVDAIPPPPPPATPYPAWWKGFWDLYGANFAKLTEDEAKKLIFKRGRFMNSSLAECEARILAILTDASSL
eukprot:TRINITY_DN6761_c0_g1_i1.p1 TRINITY_DN6761_c0_g1~~TRINITY_DN6761_c0_g1_i1.p1  ORF type:complete len:470 (-),score=-36.09 TRINITY_DN6761_c0_g1_i1:46-1434(-)